MATSIVNNMQPCGLEYKKNKPKPQHFNNLQKVW